MTRSSGIKFTSVEFRAYKALRHFSLQIHNMNVLVGPNNCGKSTVIRAFRIAETALRQARARNAERVHGPEGRLVWGHRVPKQSLPVSLENVHTDYDAVDSSIRFRCSNQNSLHLYFPSDGGCILILESPHGPIKTAGRVRSGFPRVHTVPELGPLEDEEFLVHEETIRRGMFTHRASRHFRNYWRLYPDGFDEFAQLISKTWPGMEIEPPELAEPVTRRLTMFCLENRMSREIYWSGLGFQVWCQLLTHISQSANADILVVDEPEIYLHPDVQRQLVGILRATISDVIVASHSTEIIGEADPSEIVIIDKSERSAKRLREIEEVQTALQSLGSLHNITLTQLARTGRLLFVENRGDFRLIRRFAKVLGHDQLATGNDITIAESEGFSAWQKATAAAWAFEKTLKARFQMGITLDRDFYCDEEIDEIIAELQKHFSPVHVHDRKEIENYLLEPTVLDAAISRAIQERNARTGQSASFDSTIEDVLVELTNPLKAAIQSQYVAKRIAYFKQSRSDDATVASEALSRVEAHWNPLSERLRIVPGKEVLRLLRTYLQEKFSITLTDLRIIDAFNREEIPEGIRQLVAQLEQFRRKTSP